MVTLRINVGGPSKSQWHLCLFGAAPFLQEHEHWAVGPTSAPREPLLLPRPPTLAELECQDRHHPLWFQWWIPNSRKVSIKSMNRLSSQKIPLPSLGSTSKKPFPPLPNACSKDLCHCHLWCPQNSTSWPCRSPEWVPDPFLHTLLSKSQNWGVLQTACEGLLHALRPPPMGVGRLLRPRNTHFQPPCKRSAIDRSRM